jgi:glycogen debranching enzyme
LLPAILVVRSCVYVVLLILAARPVSARAVEPATRLSPRAALIQAAVARARAILAGAATPRGIVAGSFYQDQWARDSAFASLGYLALGKVDIVRANLESFLGGVRDGQVPLRIGARRLEMAVRFARLPPPVMNALFARSRGPVYREDKEQNLPLDSNALQVISAYEYVKATGDRGFLAKHLGQLQRVVDWYASFVDGSQLVAREPRFGNWADNMPKRGKVLYTNVCYARSLYCLSELMAMAGDATRSASYRRLYDTARASINAQFWNGSYYRDWLAPEGRGHFSTDGNLLAVLWGVADRGRGVRILRTLDRQRLDRVVPCPSTDRFVPGLRYTPAITLGDIEDYHNGACWTWLGCVDAVARKKLGQDRSARRVLGRISALVDRDHDFLEVYERDARPYRRTGYKTDGSFAWSAGLFVWASHELGLDGTCARTREGR